MCLPLGLSTGCRTAKPDPDAASNSLHRYEIKSPHMGTLFTITMYAAGQGPAEAAAEAAFKRIDALEDVMSDYQADSELNLLCQNPPGKPVPVSRDLFDVLQRAMEISRRTGGAFDVTVGPYVRLWRFARKRKVLASPAEMRQAGSAVGWRKLELNPRDRTVTLLTGGMRLDLGGIAKGYAADQALALLKGRGIDRAIVAASGDLAIGNPPPGKKGWKIGITGIDSHENQLNRTVLLRNAAVSTSGDTEQFIEIGGTRYSHILNPFTGLGLTYRIQATVIAPNASTSDAMATAVCILGPKRGLKVIDSMPGTAALILTAGPEGKRAVRSRRFPETQIPLPLPAPNRYVPKQ